MNAPLDGVLRAQREFIRDKMIAPNRVLMTQADADKLRDELQTISQYGGDHNHLPEHRVFVHGMRLVIDPWAQGIEVAYAR